MIPSTEQKIKFIENLATVIGRRNVNPQDFVAVIRELTKHILSGQEFTVDAIKKVKEITDKLENRIDSLNFSTPEEIKDIKGQISELSRTISNLQLQKGDKGDTPVLGKDFTVPTAEEVAEIVKKDIPSVEAELEPIKNDVERLDKLFKTFEGKKVTLFGNSRGFGLYTGGTKRGLAQQLNFAAGSNMTLTYSTVNGLPTITFASSGGSGFSELTATGTVDGNNTTFTFTQQPTYIVSDGVWYKVNKGWTWSGSTATMMIPPNDLIFGVA